MHKLLDGRVVASSSWILDKNECFKCLFPEQRSFLDSLDSILP